MRGETWRKGGRGTGGGRRTGNVFKFMAAFKTPSANGRGLPRAAASGKGKGTRKAGR